MSYVEDKFHYEDWEVDNDDGEEPFIISIVNDFFKMETWHTSLIPLEYWVEMPGIGCISEFPLGDYGDCVEWIQDNYVNYWRVDE